MKELILWMVGLVGVSGFVGHFATKVFVSVMQARLGDTDPIHSSRDLPPWTQVPSWLRKTMVGIVERCFFTVVIAVGLTGTAIAMIAWTTLKGLFYWSSFKDNYQARVIAAILGSLFSLLWAIIGAYICNGQLWEWFEFSFLEG